MGGGGLRKMLLSSLANEHCRLMSLLSSDLGLGGLGEVLTIEVEWHSHQKTD